MTAGDGVAIVAWGEGGHIYTRRVLGTSPSIVYEQADPSSFGGWSEVSAGDPQISSGGDSSYAAVAFARRFRAAGPSRRGCSINRLQASPVRRRDRGRRRLGAEGADQPRVALQRVRAPGS